MNLKPYPEYKDSGVEWIGEIPKNWELRRLKYNSSINPHSKKSLSDPKIKVNFLPMEKVSEDGDYDSESETEYENVASGYTYFEDNDVLLAKITPCFENGKGTLVENLKHGFGFGTTEFHILRHGKQTYSKYLYFLTKSHLFRVIGEAFMEGAAGQKRVSTDFVKNFPMPTPSIAEQKVIVNFLNKKTSEINLTIEKDSRLIELLKEKRTALINHVVTKGLDPTVKMKDSGVEWIGEIPEDWNEIKLKFLVNITSGEYIKNDDLSSNGQYEVFGGNGFLGRADIYNVDDYALVVGRVGAKCGNVRLTTGKKWVSDNALILKTDQNYFFMLYLLQNLNLNNLANKNAQPLITSTQIKNSIAILPPKELQGQLIHYLNKELSKIDLIIEKIRIKIELLEEYKKSLIHHVVTGKVDVREVAV